MLRINLKNNTAMKVLSLILAILLWYIIGNIDDPVTIQTYTNIPVQIINEDVLKSNNKAYEITEGETVTFTVRGKTSILNKLTEEDFKAQADLEKLSLVNSVPIEVTVSRYGDEVDITLGRTNTVKVNVENRVESMLPVVVETDGTPAEGFAIGTKTSSPNMVEVAGAESMINRLKEIRVVVKTENASQDINTRQSIKFYDQNGDEVDADRLDCDTKMVSVTVDLWETREIELSLKTTGTPAEGYGISMFDYEPKTVLVAASDEMIDKIEDLSIGTLSVTGAKENVEKTISMDSSALPQGVVFCDGTIDIVAKAVIEKKVSDTIGLKSKDIQIQNLPEGMEVVFDKVNYNIPITSYKSKISNLDGTSFEPYIDISELKGETKGKLRIHLINPEGVTVTDTVYAEVMIR